MLIFGINPGNGPDDSRLTCNEEMMPALKRFISHMPPASFLDAQRAYWRVQVTFRVYRQVLDVLRFWSASVPTHGKIIQQERIQAGAGKVINGTLGSQLLLVG